MLNLFGKTLTSLTRDQRRVFYTLSICFITMHCPDTIVPPFFPSEARRHGVSCTLTGMIVGGSALVGLVASPFIGAIIAVTGPKKVIITGMIFVGISSVLFGCLEYVQSTYWFAIGSWICIGFVSLGNVTIYTATLTYAAILFPDNFNLVAGMTELYIGTAEVIALLPGAVLHEYGGFKLPFMFFGFLHLLFIPLNLLVLPPDPKIMNSLSTYSEAAEVSETESWNDLINVDSNSVTIITIAASESNNNNNNKLVSKSKLPTLTLVSADTRYSSKLKTKGKTNYEQNLLLQTYSAVVNSDSESLLKFKFKNEKNIPTKLRLWHLLTIPRTVLMAGVILGTSICWSFINFTLEPHLSPLALTKTETNLVFLMTSVVYGISSPICGWFADSLQKTWKMVASGLVLAGITFGFLGLGNTIWLNVFGLTAVTIAINIAAIPAIEATLLYTMEAGHKDTVGTYAIVSSLISTCNSAGLAIGSFTGGILFENYGYSSSAGLYGVICVAAGTMIFVYFKKCHDKDTPHKKKRVSPRNSFQLPIPIPSVLSPLQLGK